MPSCTSGPEKPMNSMASDASKVGPAMRSQLLSACLVQRTAARRHVAQFLRGRQRGLDHFAVVGHHRDEADALGLLAG